MRTLTLRIDKSEDFERVREALADIVAPGGTEGAVVAALAFDLTKTDGRLAFRRALEGEKWADLAYELDEMFLRPVTKWSEDAIKQEHYWQVREWLCEEMRERRLSTLDDGDL